ncbi:MAG: FecR domain-containing protein [Hyphomicrobium sp.]|nr:FecR domain-containing protein [Hyphomicrobium sp.]
MGRRSSLLCAASLVIASTAAAHAETTSADNIGTTLQVVNVVTAALSTQTRTLSIGDGVRQNEVIEAAADARTELKLEDETKLALGPGARLVLDRFVYDPDKRNGNIAVDLLKGTFRFMTGVATKPSYVIRVPNASITVRGTIFDVFVQLNGATWVLLHEGGIKICNDRGRCRVHSEAGKLILVNDEGEIGKPFRWASLDGAQGFGFDDAFPFVANPPSIDPTPLFTKEALLDDAKPARTKPKSPDRKAEVTDPTSRSDATPGTSATTAETPDATVVKPPRVVIVKPPRFKKPRQDADATESETKPPRIKKPKLDTASLGEKGRNWRRIAEDAASNWINRVKVRKPSGSGLDSASSGSRTTTFEPKVVKKMPSHRIDTPK